ncbi:MAG TPA: GGDEF domain-containing protein [Pseudogracilibacillus sp.]|nr:GGDEF domain-containing protein [Pseudogracilibacillus sp.]
MISVRGNQIVEQLKANLFELTYIINKYKHKEVMNMLCDRTKKILGASHVAFYLYNKSQLEQQCTYYVTSDLNCFKEANTSTFTTYFHEAANITVVDGHHFLVQKVSNELNFLIKVHCQKSFFGFMFITFNKQHIVSSKTLEKVKVIVEQFLSTLYKNRRYNFVQKHNHLLFQLSSKLHSVNQTTEVIEKVYRMIQSIYPSFRSYFLMSQEFENTTLPIKLIEYSGGKNMSPEIKTFLNNEIEIEYNDEKIETNIYSPLSGNQGIYGVLQVIIPHKVNLVKEEKTFIKNFTNMIGRAIERTTLFQSSNQLVNDLQMINVASHELNVNLEQDEIIDTVKKHIFTSCQAEQIGVVFFSKGEKGKGKLFEIMVGSTDYFATDDARKFVRYLYDKLRVAPNPFLTGNFQCCECISIPYSSLMVIPLRVSDSIFGMIIALHKMPYYFSFDTYKFIQSFVQHASLAFTNSILKEKLRKTAITDYLTKLYSRNFLDKIITESMIKDGKGAFILFDVDDFKLINDTYGHYIGDKVLVQVANIIQMEIGAKEIAARWGGEEFAIYMPHYNLHQATEKANRIRKKVIHQTDPQVSLSCGVSIWTSSEEDSIEKLFIRTDKALYEAKSSGKNKVVQKNVS